MSRRRAHRAVSRLRGRCLRVPSLGARGAAFFGDYAGPYGDLISNLAKPQRHIANAVTAVVFDYRGFDTMGEELILFGAASAVVMLLRETREADVADIVDRVRSDATNAVSASSRRSRCS